MQHQPAAFLDPLRVAQVGWAHGRPKWRTLTRLRYRSARLGGVVEVPAEFDFDEASVPRLPLVWLIAGGRGKAASAVHDYGYQRRGLVIDGVFRALSRRAIDAAGLLEAMEADPMSGAGAVTRWVMWATVRACGWWPWHRHSARAATLNPIWTGTDWPTLV